MAVCRHQTIARALDWILASTPEIPLWPQLPAIPSERMLNQFIEGMPGIIEVGYQPYFDIHTESFAAEQLSFYEDYLMAFRLLPEPERR